SHRVARDADDLRARRVAVRDGDRAGIAFRKQSRSYSAECNTDLALASWRQQSAACIGTDRVHRKSAGGIRRACQGHTLNVEGSVAARIGKRQFFDAVDDIVPPFVTEIETGRLH